MKFFRFDFHFKEEPHYALNMKNNKIYLSRCSDIRLTSSFFKTTSEIRFRDRSPNLSVWEQQTKNYWRFLYEVDVYLESSSYPVSRSKFTTTKKAELENCFKSLQSPQKHSRMKVEVFARRNSAAICLTTASNLRDSFSWNWEVNMFRTPNGAKLGSK